MKKDAMIAIALTGVIDCEVYLLMTMKPRLSLTDTRGLLDSKIADAGLTPEAAAAVHRRVASILRDEASRFREMEALLGVNQGAMSLKYGSLLWPGFEFRADADENGGVKSATYRRSRRPTRELKHPADLAAWSIDIPEFNAIFGPAIRRAKRPPFDEILPAYEEYELEWNGDRYGARFLWGLFLSSSACWE